MTVFDRIVKWNKERGLETFRSSAEYAMLQEEMNELKDALNDKNEYEIIDALCDLIVIAAGSMYKLGYDPNCVMEETLKEIESRIGKFDPGSGKWVKDVSEQAKKRWYKAKYDNCKRIQR